MKVRMSLFIPMCDYMGCTGRSPIHGDKRPAQGFDDSWRQASNPAKRGLMATSLQPGGLRCRGNQSRQDVRRRQASNQARAVSSPYYVRATRAPQGVCGQFGLFLCARSASLISCCNWLATAASEALAKRGVNAGDPPLCTQATLAAAGWEDSRKFF